MVIVGSNTTDTILKKQVEELGVQAFVDFEGWQNVALIVNDWEIDLDSLVSGLR